MALIMTSYLGHKRDIPYYRPFVLRTEFLTSLLIVTLVLISLIEYACQIVPGHDGFRGLPSIIMNDSRQPFNYLPHGSPPKIASFPASFMTLSVILALQTDSISRIVCHRRQARI